MIASIIFLVICVLRICDRFIISFLSFISMIIVGLVLIDIGLFILIIILNGLINEISSFLSEVFENSPYLLLALSSMILVIIFFMNNLLFVISIFCSKIIVFV